MFGRATHASEPRARLALCLLTARVMAHSENEKEQKFDQLISSFKDAMLVTHGKDGELHARPLTLASADANGDVWFSTGAHSGKVAEIFHDRRVAVIMQASSRYLSLTGTAEVIADRAKAAVLWRETWRPWFPGGPDDPEIVLVHVKGTEAEFWDLRGLAGVMYVFDAVKHALKGERMSDGPSRHHDTVRFPRRA
jgi:general stress protein 26